MSQQPPLYLRLYFHHHLTELVRLIGYEEIPTKQVESILKPLVKKYGEARVVQATEEILEIDNSRRTPVARLSEQARKLAVGILGRPRDSSSAELSASPNAPGVPSTDPKPQNARKTARKRAEQPRLRAVRLPRSEVIPHYIAWLEQNGKYFVSIEEAKQSICGDVKLFTLDFVVYGEPLIRLVTVRRSLRQKQRDDMRRWLEVFGGGYVAARIWPLEGGEDWTWKQYAIAP